MRPIDINGQEMGQEITLLISEHHVALKRIRDAKEYDEKQHQQDQFGGFGGFGQEETEIVLQNPLRIIGYLGFCLCVLLTQILLILKKKQFEKVQAAELNF